MVIEVTSVNLLSTLKRHMKGRTKSSINITVLPNNNISIQSSNDYLFDTILLCEKCTFKEGESFSFLINNAINLLTESQDIVSLTRDKDKVTLTQENVSIQFDTTYDERINIKHEKFVNCGSVGNKDLASILRGFKSLIGISKSLEKGIPNVVIVSGRFFCLYSNTMLIGRAPVSMPDIDIPYTMFNNIVKNLDSSSSTIFNDVSSKLILMQTGSSDMSTFNYKIPNIELIESVDSKVNELSFVGNYDITNLRKLQLINKIFPKENLIMSMYSDDTIGFTISISDGKSIKAGVKDISTDCNISISTAQLDALYKVFNAVEKVEVFKGRDVLCIKSSIGISMIMSGMIF